ncbi:ABC transporter permease [Desulfomonile tiedjei]|uniref:ABC-type antimicrobial peptide transport system, permease component n=1 Tax=Desulfomonile tiedjei (strain ATCC 49306 / DSM 6799 / DCB-1) TaxID=706587 RepID=I4CEU8_DESTA|nr:ABC transporter permease [Desulfomonile tiedjei]AFM28089.1 ABC-type antimicrobial peptide transport system, permease component [Desulfomonile tiedjei DSM 6799]
MRTTHVRGFHIALKSLMGHPMRVALAVLAIMIGVGSVIIMVGIGRGAEDDVRQRIESMGTNLIVVSAGPSRSVKGQLGSLRIMTTLTLKDAAAIGEECPSVREVAPAYSKKLAIKFENVSYSTRVVGATPSIQSIRNISIEHGAFFDDEENRLMAPIAVVGPTVVQNLFLGRDPIGESIRIGKVLFKVIGVTVPKGNVSGEDEDDQIIVPLRTAMNRLMNVTYLSNIFVEATDFENIHIAETEIRVLLRERHRLREGRDNDFTIQNQADVIETQGSVAKTFSLLVASIAAVSLLIGGVGILGVMLLSIRERVSEIGIRRAVGARRRDILTQFLAESAFLGIVGGVAGLMSGVAVSWGIGYFSGMPVVLVPEYVVLSLVFSLATGLIFGIYPAWKAAGLDPIDALNTRT